MKKGKQKKKRWQKSLLTRPWQQPAPLSILPTRPLRIWGLKIKIRIASIFFAKISTKIHWKSVFFFTFWHSHLPLPTLCTMWICLAIVLCTRRGNPEPDPELWGLRIMIAMIQLSLLLLVVVLLGFDDDLVYKFREGGSTRTAEFRGPWSFRLCHVTLPPGTISLRNYIAVFKKMKKYGGL